MSNDVIIEAVNLTKQYPGKLALKGLNLSVKRGEIFGYLGPNGAGKSTTIRLILNLIRPSRGSVRVLGLDSQRDSVKIKQHIGNLPSEVRLWEQLTGTQVIEYLARLRPGCEMAYALSLADRLELNLKTTVRDYSTGNKRKLGLVQALMHRPALLILDEPTTGLDPLMQQRFYELMLEVRAAGGTVFLSSHILAEVDAICDRVGILRDGTLQTIERVEDLKQVQYRWLTLYTHTPGTAETWSDLSGVSEVQMLAEGVRLRVTGAMEAVIQQAAQYTVYDVTIEEPSLEDVFLAYYGND